MRADDLRTKRTTLRVFAGQGSARVFGAGVVVALVARAVIGSVGLGDAVVLAVTLAAVGPIEWFLHRVVLHAPDDAWTSRRLGTGDGHRQHHIDPPELQWLLLRGADALAVSALFAFFTAVWVIPVTVLVATPVWGSLVTGWGLVAAGFLHYEWVHLLIHTRYRCRTPYYRRLAANHRRHHYRNEGYWLGVTSNTGDRLARTLPADPGDVPLSATARTLVSPG
ncbi:MAG: sterol desaturase family protein [Ilumatobacter sp.]